MNDQIPFLGFSTTLLELISFLLSVITVALNIRQLHWAWLFSILASGLYAVVFFDAKLYGDMGLQFVFIAVSVWGWAIWLRWGGDANKIFAPGRLSFSQVGLVSVGWAIAFILFAWFLKTFTDTDVPYMDGFLTAGSLLGQLLLSRKKIENWYVWIIVDVLYVGLYLYKNLILTAMLYAIFVAMAVVGLRTWSKSCRL